MVCKEDVIRWFKDLSGFKRIDFMCGLLNMCVPFELRFFGTCVEDLGKKDFHYLREAERKANIYTEMAKLTNLNDDVTRSKLIVSLALLESSNHVCSNVIFKTLTDAEKFSNLSHLPLDKYIEEILLLFTMALHHPAFTFDQKSSLGERLLTVKSVLRSTSCEENEVLEEPVTDKQSASKVPCVQHTASPTLRTIKSLDLRKFCRKRPDKKSEFRIQVLWSNGESTEVAKNYQELYEFSLKVQHLLPEGKRSHRQDKNLPLLPAPRQVSGFKASDEVPEDGVPKVQELVQDYLQKFLPSLLDCDVVIAFFHGHPVHASNSQWPSSNAHVSPSRQSSQASSLGSPRGNAQSQQCCPSTSKSLQDESIIDVGRVKSLTIYNSQIDRSGKNSQDGNKGKQAAHRDIPNPPGSQFPIAVSCSSPLTSPHPSPISSPFASPSQSGTSSRAASPWTQRSCGDAEGAKAFHKSDRYKRCKGKANAYASDEVEVRGGADDEIREGLSFGEINKLTKLLEHTKLNPPNGLNLCGVVDKSASISNTPSSVTAPFHSGVSPYPTITTTEGSALPNQVYQPPQPTGHHMVYQALVSPHSSVPPTSALTPTTQPTSTFTMMSPIVTAAAPSIGAITIAPTATGVAPIPAPPFIQNGITHILHHHHPPPPPASTLLPRHVLPQFQPQMQQHNQPLPIQCQRVQTHQLVTTGASTESSPSCSENSSPPESPSLDYGNNYDDSSCSEETDKGKESLAKIDNEAGKTPRPGGIKVSSDVSVNKLMNKPRDDDRIHQMSASIQPTSHNQSTRHTELPLRSSSTLLCSSEVIPPPPAAILPGGNSAQQFQRARLNSSSSASSGNSFHAFKTGLPPQQMTSPVRSSSNNSTMIFENSQYIKTTGMQQQPHQQHMQQAATPTTPLNWESMNGTCPTAPSNGGSQQYQPSNNHGTVFVITTTPQPMVPPQAHTDNVAAAASVATCRTSCAIMSSSIVVTCATRQSQTTTTVNMSNVRSHTKPLMSTASHVDEAHKVNNNNSNSSMPPNSSTCLPCVGHGSDLQSVTPHPGTYLTQTPVSYPSMPPNPVASTTVTYTASTYVPVVNHGQSATNQSTATAVAAASQVPQSHGAVSSGCTSTPGSIYSPGIVPLQIANSFMPRFPAGFLHANGNSFISHTLPNFPFASNHLAASGIHNGMTTELMYPGSQFPMMQQNGSLHTNQVNPGFMPGHAPNVGFSGNYNPSSQMPHKGKTVSCYNCGVVGHRGGECKEATMEEITKPGQLRLNYAPSKAMESTE